MTEPVALHAGIFRLPELDGRHSARDLWSSMAEDVAGEFPELYSFDERQKFKLRILTDAAVSADNKYVRFRTIEADIRRRSGRSTLLDLSVGNMFAEAKKQPLSPIHMGDAPQYATWARSAGTIPLTDHHRFIRRFTQDLLDAGWILEPDEWAAITLPAPVIVTSRGTCALPEDKLSSVARQPIAVPRSDASIAVVSSSKSIADRAVSDVSRAFQQLLPGIFPKGQRIYSSAVISTSAVNLILLKDSEDLNQNATRRDQLRNAEINGVRFKLCKESSLTKTYPIQNIAYDLFQIAGGTPWIPAHQQLPFCSLDAGHDPETRRSRWARVEMDGRQKITSVIIHETSLAEHMQEDMIDRMWPSDELAILCRDGRLSQEREIFERRADRERRPLIEAKKSPKAMLWRMDGREPKPARFGDAIMDSHGDILLQTVAQNARDYIRPLRLSTHGHEAIDLAKRFFDQQAVPGLSLFKMSRLPGALYFADLASKLTNDGWPKVVGRGFSIPMIIPQ